MKSSERREPLEHELANQNRVRRLRAAVRRCLQEGRGIEPSVSNDRSTTRHCSSHAQQGAPLPLPAGVIRPESSGQRHSPHLHRQRWIDCSGFHSCRRDVRVQRAGFSCHEGFAGSQICASQDSGHTGPGINSPAGILPASGCATTRRRFGHQAGLFEYEQYSATARCQQSGNRHAESFSGQTRRKKAGSQNGEA